MVSALHPANAPSPMLFSFLPRVTDCKDLHSPNEASPILVVALGIVTAVMAVPANAPSPMDFSFAFLLKDTLLKSSHIKKAALPILVHFFGTVIFFISSENANAPSPISKTFAPIFTLVRLLASKA